MHGLEPQPGATESKSAFYEHTQSKVSGMASLEWGVYREELGASTFHGAGKKGNGGEGMT